MVVGQLDPTSLVARIIAELQANPDAQRMLLRAVFGEDALPVVAGYGIDPIDAERAEAAGVDYLEVAPPRPF